jgi:hypothetical protein
MVNVVINPSRQQHSAVKCPGNRVTAYKRFAHIGYFSLGQQDTRCGYLVLSVERMSGVSHCRAELGPPLCTALDLQIGLVANHFRRMATRSCVPEQH